MSYIYRVDATPWTLKPPLGTPIDWSNPLASSLVIDFELNEYGGNIVYNAINQSIGNITNAIWRGDSLYIDASSDRITYNYNFTDTQLPYLSVEMLFISRWNYDDGKDHYFFDTYGGSNSRFLLYKASTNQLILFTNNTERATRAIYSFIENNLYHIVVNVPSNTVYINGNIFNNYDDGGLGNGATTLYIGDRYAIADRGLNGNLKYFRVRNKELTQSEIISLYTSQYQIFQSPLPYWLRPSAVEGQPYIKRLGGVPYAAINKGVW